MHDHFMTEDRYNYIKGLEDPDLLFRLLSSKSALVEGKCFGDIFSKKKFIYYNMANVGKIEGRVDVHANYMIRSLMMEIGMGFICFPVVFISTRILRNVYKRPHVFFDMKGQSELIEEKFGSYLKLSSWMLKVTREHILKRLVPKKFWTIGEDAILGQISARDIIDFSMISETLAYQKELDHTLEAANISALIGHELTKFSK